MESRAKLLGHPIHPMLVVMPLGSLVAAGIFDAVALKTRRATFATAAFWNVTVGLVTGLAAAVFGLWDWLAIPWGTRAKVVGLWHAAGNLVVVALFSTSWLLRRKHPARPPGALIAALEGAGLSVGLVSGWLGGELVDRLGVGVDQGAHLNATNSLSGAPARLSDR